MARGALVLHGCPHTCMRSSAVPRCRPSRPGHITAGSYACHSTRASPGGRIPTRAATRHSPCAHGALHTPSLPHRAHLPGVDLASRIPHRRHLPYAMATRPSSPPASLPLPLPPRSALPAPTATWPSRGPRGARPASRGATTAGSGRLTLTSACPAPRVRLTQSCLPA